MVCTASSTPVSGETLMGGTAITKPKMCGITVSTGFTCMGAISSLTFQCKKEGSTAGTLYGRVYNSGTTLKCTLGDMDASTVSTSMTQYTFNSPDTTYTLQDGDKIVFEYADGTVSENHTIKEADCIDFSFSRTPIEDVYTKIVLRYNWDYARGEFNDSVEALASDVYPDTIYDYYGFQGTTDDPDADSTLIIDDDRGKFFRNNSPNEDGNDQTAEDFAGWYLMWSLNQHLKMKVKLPLKYMNLEIGDIVEFDELLGGISPFGINYKTGSVVGLPSFQTIYKYFMITETNKLIDYVQISCVQMHKLYDHTVDQTYE